MKGLTRVSKLHHSAQFILLLLACCVLLTMSLSVVLAGPQGAQVVNGEVTIQQSGLNTNITASDRSIINYSSFDIARPEIVEFIQPSNSASVLNRILSANPTNIDGTLLANGRVFFVNPAGIYFGNGARVNVNQLVASALNISDADFINGIYNFAGGNGSVINSGDISAEKVYLIGKQVANSGTISCPAGYVVMAAGERVFLSEQGSGILLEVEAPTLPAPADSVGVLNEGTVSAAGGQIVLAAAGDIYSQAISNVGSLSVSAEAGNAGEIKITSTDGQVTNAGTIEASGSAGGAVEIEGENVTLTAESAIHADATGDGDGGTIRISSDTLDIDGIITAGSIQGAPGHILLDPQTWDIDAGEAATIVAGLETADVEVKAEDTINVNADIDSSSQTSATTLSLNDEDSDNDLTINLNALITLGVNQTLTGQGTIINVAAAGSIQNGIDVASTETSIWKTIYVADDTYTEDLTVNKSNLTLRSVNGRDNTTIQLVDGVGINIGSGATGFKLGVGPSNGFTILGGGATTFDIQLTNGPSGVEISWNTINTTGNATMGINVGAAGATGLNINNNIFTANTGDGCIWGGAPITNLQISTNEFSGPGKGISSYAMELCGVAETTTSVIADNIVDGFNYGIGIFNGTSATPTDGLDILHNDVKNCSKGIWLRQYAGDGTLQNVTVQANTLTGNTTGIEILDTDVDASSISITNNFFINNTTGIESKHNSESATIYENSFTGNTSAVKNTGALAILNASGNWWGSYTEADIQGQVTTGKVDYTPWLASGVDSDPTNGFQGDFSELYVSADSPQFGATGRINEAIGLVSADGLINILTGSYAEEVTVNKNVTLSVPSGTATMTKLTSDALKTTGLSGSFAADGSGTDPVFWFKGAVTLAGDTTLTSSNDKNITFGSTINGGHTLAVNTAGVTTFGDNVGTGEELTSLTTNVSGDVKATNGVEFGEAVTANGGTQVLDADSDNDGTGDLTAGGSITKTTAGDLTLGGAAIKLGGDVKGTAAGSNVTFDDAVTANGTGAQTFDAEQGTLTANSSITKSTAGTLTLGGATAMNLKGDVKGTAAGSNVTFDDAVTANGTGAQTFDAEQGTLTANSS
ncbi:MAG: filamentous hemagglutinin N-terminal domain-containing protein, partial [Sedimentisphaerales bacterium]|nr:filamentous hemagglutinin N-terminal domain-containing protein [Sedimentisphaerales bacterium]